jgi:hypothetical protein
MLLKVYVSEAEYDMPNEYVWYVITLVPESNPRIPFMHRVPTNESMLQSHGFINVTPDQEIPLLL